ncbi:Putative zinc-finger [Bryocella elongata]|uniref:Putative zinc-finger n=1 Tax=Bryocella elongata TaxID=863522 RepID=A0A1H6CCL5_9BACT|nr:zf-HC2 domain-containing protein [Bryocella elongata]SEG70583.1 Putative zinc-finger [Bryocella elongata]
MTEFRNQFEQEWDEKRPTACTLCEAMLPDAVDGTLSPAEQRIFDQHVASCVECSQELEEAQRGAAWLSMLKSQTPEPPENLLAKILAGTTGTQPMPAPEAVPVWAQPAPQREPSRGSSWSSRLSALRSRVGDLFRIDNAAMSFQPRLAMTAAMAFFSIALTLNLTGFRLRDVRAENFTPGGIRRSVSDISASAARSFQNLRVVYQVEARVNELRDDLPTSGNRDGQPGSDRPTFEAQPQTVQPRQDENKNQPAPNESRPGDNGSQKDDSRPHGRSELILPEPQKTGRNEVATHKAA